MKIKVKDVVKGPDACEHYQVTFDLGDGTEHTEVLHADEGEVSSDIEFVQAWLKFQFKYKADKMKLKGKEISVEK